MAQTPVLVVEEDTAILYTRALFCLEIIAHNQARFLLWYHIAPPYPRRYTCQTGEFEQPISQTSPIAALNDDLSTFYINAEAIDR